MLIMATLFGCVREIPKEWKAKVDRSITFAKLRESPDAYKGKEVMFGGRIIKTQNTKSGTMLEVLEEPLDSYDMPRSEEDSSGGRFLALYKGYLDSAIYQPGRQVTVVGEVKGSKTQSLDDLEYTYPYIEAENVHLWRKYTERSSSYYEAYPYWWYYPYTSPVIIERRRDRDRDKD